MKRIFKKIFLIIIILLLILVGYFFIGKTKPAENITWGVNFSQRFAQDLGLNWQETYSALLNDLDVKNLKVSADWDLIESRKGEFNFDNLDWQIKTAEENNAKIILIIGIKTGRWPECHAPEWAKGLDKENQQAEILKILDKIVLRYKDSPAIKYWQVENEPFFPFGECTWVDKNFLKEEVSLVKELDQNAHPIIITDSGEGSFWSQAAKIGDIAGTTLYKKVWFSFDWEKDKIPFFPKELGFYVSYPFPATFYHRKAELIDKLFHKKVIITELQAEPWGPNLIYNVSLEEQTKTMNLKQFIYNINFARNTGMDEIYLWGGEWWYWMKIKQNQPQIWEEARKLFQ